MIEATIGRIAGGENLSLEEMFQAIEAIMSGHCNDQEIGLLLTGLRMKGETVEEIAGAAKALRQHMTPLRSSRKGLLDTCGTGGDGRGTFNVSTAAAIVTAAAGVPVAKHGNRSASGTTGSSEVLAELGVNVEADLSVVEACLDELGICFCYAPLFHESMRHVANVRRLLGFPTIFNLLGPLANPAGADYQLLGVGFSEYRTMMAEALAILGVERATVVCGEDGLDEVTITGRTAVSHLSGGPPQELVWEPDDFGLKNSSLDALLVKSPAESAAMIRSVLSGEASAARDIVVMNAASALWTATVSHDLKACAQQAAEAIDRNAAQQLLERLAERTHA